MGPDVDRDWSKIKEGLPARARGPKVGAYVFFSKYAGTLINWEGEEYLVLEAEDLYGEVNNV